MIEFLRKLGLEQYASVFLENEVDFKTLQVLTDSDLKELGLPFGPRKLLLNSLAELKRSDAAAPAVTAVGERRQLTVLFCDLVGFTELASRLDPEVLQTIITRYEDTCAVCISRYEGYLFQRLGDGIVAFFGFPLAHEGEAERAIRAGLEIIETLNGLDLPEVGYLKVRIGIATGVVVVTSGEKGAVGETMNLAARLQAIAETGSIVVSERVHRLAGGAFDYADLGEYTLKGIALPTRAYRVLGVSVVASRFEAATQEGMTPFVGREQEMSLLLERWRFSRDGQGQVVFLSGEAGIGKSRIAMALREHLETQVVRLLHFQCSPYHANSAFYPIIDHLERELQFGRDEPPDSKLDKLEAFVVKQYGRPIEDARFVAGILSIPCQDRYGALSMTPRRHKEETIRALVELTEAAARTQPSLMLFEDLHWADPTTLEVLDLLIERISNAPLLILFTNRPEFRPRWTQHAHVASLNLARLTHEQSGAIVCRVTGGKTFPPELLEQIIAKTDGVPLFVEELTKSILESGNLKEEGGHYTYVGASASMTIPATLRDSLIARLDRVASVKQVAQIGAVIGREFSYELIAVVAPMNEAALVDGLAKLTESGLAHNRGTIPEAVFIFKHALVQDTAYDSLLKSTRQQLHGRIARVLDERFPGIKDAKPELLAQHYTAAGLDAPAVPYWRRAGEVALQRFALPEAITHLQKGLAVVQTLPSARERDLSELDLRTLLGPALVAHRGWAQPEVKGILEPAWTLAESLQHQQSYLPILHGVWVHYLCLGRLADSLNWAEKLLTAAASANDSDLEIVGHRAAAASYFWLGDLLSARKHGDRIRSMYDPQRHWSIASLTNTDPLTGDGIYRGQYIWMLGYPDQAVAFSDEKDAHARRRNHPFDLAFALTLGAQVFDFVCEPDPLLKRTEEAERVAREHRVSLMSEVMVEISKGIAWLRAGRFSESAVQLRESIERLSRTGHRIWIWYLRALWAESLARSGKLEEALVLIHECVERIEAGEDRVHFAEVLRLKGWMLKEQDRMDDAEHHLRRAIQVARGQQAKSWELRAATTLARLLADRGDSCAARALLAPVYGWFTEGFGTKDLKEARNLLEELES